MNRLWVRLSIAFSVIVFLAFAVVTVANLFVVRAQVSTTSREQLTRDGGLTNALAAHYAENDRWDGVETLMRGANSAFPSASDRRRNTLLLFDANGRPVYGTDRPMMPNTPPSARLSVMVDGQTVGVLVVAPERDGLDSDDRGGERAGPLGPPGSQNRPPPPPIRDDDEEKSGLLGFFRPLGFETTLLLIAVVGTAGGLSFGVATSRTLTQPLASLADGVDALARGEKDRRVSVRGSEEIAGLARSFNAMADELERAETLRRGMVADVAHELRTPLTALQSNLYALLDDVYPLTKEEIARLYDQTRLLERLVGDLHTLAQAEAQQLPIHKTPLDPATLVTDTVEGHRAMAEAKGITLGVTTVPGLPPISGDAARLRQVMQNLIGNAVRHTPNGGEIRVQVDAAATGVRVSVEDTGEGIAPEHLPNIFERFYRADAARNRQGGGSGLGLAITRALVTAHGGTVEAFSPAAGGVGTRFEVWLPLVG
ncbi:MAG: ATP-binding protein [Chloroflexota bacterium]